MRKILFLEDNPNKMKRIKLFFSFFNDFLADFHWYRKKRGGTWYKVLDNEGAGGFEASIEFWTREPGDKEVLKAEDYTKRKTL